MKLSESPQWSGLSFRQRLVLDLIEQKLATGEGLLYFKRTPDGYKWLSGMMDGSFKVGAATFDCNYSAAAIFTTHKRADRYFDKLNKATDTPTT